MKLLCSVVPFEALEVECVVAVHLVFRLGFGGSMFTQVTPGHRG